MMFRTHLIFGVFISLLLLNLGEWYYVFLFVLSGALLPDIDFSRSKVGRKFGFISEVIEFLFGHRKLFHSWFFAVLLSFIVVYFFNFNYGLLFFIGYLSHLVSDGLTKEGVRLFHPLKYKIRGMFRSGGSLEFVFFIFFIVLNLFLVYNMWW